MKTKKINPYKKIVLAFFGLLVFGTTTPVSAISSPPDLIFSSNTNINNDDLTTDNSPVFDVICEEFKTVYLYVDGVEVNSHSCISNGAEQVTANSMAIGMHSINYTYDHLDFSPSLLMMVSTKPSWEPPYNLPLTQDIILGSYFGDESVQGGHAVCYQADMQTCANKNFYLDGDEIVFSNTATLGMSHPKQRAEIRQLGGEWDTGAPTLHINEGLLKIARWDINVPQITLAQLHHVNEPRQPKVGPLLRIAVIREKNGVHNHLWAAIKNQLSPNFTSTFIDLGPINMNEYFSIKIVAGNNKLNVWFNGQQKIFDRNIDYWAGARSYFKNGTYFPYDDNLNAQTEIRYKNIIWSILVRADVDQSSVINSTDAMLTLRNSLGLDMSSTNWHTSATTGDVNCDSSSNSTDAMLILRHSLGLSDGAGWCGG